MWLGCARAAEPLIISNMGQKTFFVGSGQPTLGDLIQVVCGSVTVDVDPSAAQRVKKESPPPKQFQAEDTPDHNALDNSTSFIPKDCIRAAFFLKLQSLVNGKSKCRLAVAQHICDMLNRDVIPRVPECHTDREVFARLADSFHGVGVDCSGVDIAVAMEKNGITPPSLSSDERLILQDGEYCSSGVSSICTEGGKLILSLTTYIAAMSAEVLKAEVKCFEAEISETYPLKYSSDIADVLKNMFSGSTQAIVKKNNTVIKCITDIPAVHGAAQMGLDAIAVPAKACLASVALPPHKSGVHGHYMWPKMGRDMICLGQSLVTAALMSIDRSLLVVETMESDADLKAIMDETRIHLKSHIEFLYALDNKLSNVAEHFQKTDAVENLSHVNCSLACYEALEELQACIVYEIIISMTGLYKRQRDSEESKSEGDANKSKKKSPGFVLGKGTEALVLSLHSMLAESELQDGFASLNLSGIPSIFSNTKDTRSKLCKFISICHPGLKNILDSVGRTLEANAATRKPKIAKGARDFGPEQMAIREVAFQKITNVFKRHGAVSIDTPVFELRETLMGKYGEDSKLIYDLADQGGEILSLRYDLTVPFARHVAVHGLTNIKRYHIAKVYRRDQPQMTKGRYREFFQCDFDIAGVYSPMVPDAEVLKVLVEILDDLSLGDYEIKINHRKLLDAMLDIAGVPPQKFRPICSAIDKLDKEPWEAVKKEMVEEKGLPEHVADKIGEFVVLKGEPREVLRTLQQSDHPLSSHPESAAALQDMATLFDFLDVMDALKPFSFDLSLARGLDYYTGVIYEAVFKGGSVGSIAAGGRYDGLVGMFSGKEVPAVGVSIGIERVFAIMEAQMKEQAKERNGTIRETETEVLVASIGNGLQPQRMKIASNLWKSGVKCEFGFKPNPKMGDQLNYALKTGIPLVILFGEDEINSGKVKLKDLDAETEITVPEEDIIKEVKAKLATMGERRVVFQSA